MREELVVSERRACEVVGQPRGTQRYTPRGPDDERALVKRMRELSAAHPRYGYRRVWALLRVERFAVNRKRVQRLWRREGLKVPQKQRKRRRLGHSGNSCASRKAEHVNHVWSYDFVLDQTRDGRRLKLLPVVDEFTRECLAIEVERRLTARDVVATLKYLFELRGAPAFRPLRQRPGVHRRGGEGVADGERVGDAVHRAGQPVAGQSPNSRSCGRTRTWRASTASWKTSCWTGRSSRR